MTRKIALALIVFLVLGVPALATAGEERHSGRVVELRPDGRLVLEEMGPWAGPGTGLAKRTIELPPSASVREIRSTGKWDNDAMPGYEVRPLDLKAVKPGDFVNLAIARDRRPVAVSLEVVRPEGADGGLASPQPESTR